MDFLDKIIIVRTHKNNFYKMKEIGPNNEVGDEVVNEIIKEFNYSKPLYNNQLLDPLIKLYDKMFPDGPNGDEVDVSKMEGLSKYRYNKTLKVTPDIISSCKQIPTFF